MCTFSYHFKSFRCCTSECFIINDEIKKKKNQLCKAYNMFKTFVVAEYDERNVELEYQDTRNSTSDDEGIDD